MKQSTKTAFLYALPLEMIIGDAEEITTGVAYHDNAMPMIVARHLPNGVIEASLSLTKKWFDETLAAQKSDEDPIHIIATMALPALSLSAELWADAIEMLEDKLDRLGVNEVVGVPFAPSQLGINLTTKYAISDWYAGFPTGFQQEQVMKYEISHSPVDVSEDEEYEEYNAVPDISAGTDLPDEDEET